jgi:hypothetical protein
MAQPVTSAFRPALIRDHTVEVAAQVIDSDGGVLATLQPIGGNVTVDIDRDIRREAGDLTLVDPTGTLTPDDIADILSPLSGNEIVLSRGISYFGNTTPELITLGTFGFTSITVDNQGQGLTVTVGGLQDRAARISRARYVRPYSITTPTALETVVAGLLRRTWPAIPGTDNFPTTGVTVRSLAWGSEGDSDPWSDAVDLCDAKGFRLYFDPSGTPAMEQITDLSALTELVRYDADGDGTNTANPMILGLSRTWDVDQTFNGVVATGEYSGLLLPFQSVAWDDDPASPTYYLGDFGKRPRFYSTWAIYNKTDAVTTAQAQLKKTLGITETVTWSQIPDPSLDVGDGVYVVNPEVAVDNLYRIDRIDIPLSPLEPMTVTARTRRIRT